MAVALTVLLGVVVVTSVGAAEDPSPHASPSPPASRKPSPAPAAAGIPTALETVACDEPRALIAVDEPWAASAALDDPLAALEAAVAQIELAPRSGYRILSLDDTGTYALFGYLDGADVKAAVRIRALDDAATSWVPDGVAVCHVSELGDAPMAPGIALWTNRSGRAIHETGGSEACGPAVRFVFLTRPRGDGTYRTRAYARDPEGDLRHVWQSSYRRETQLPRGARFSGYHRDGARLFTQRDGDAVHVRRGRSVERWPRVPLPNDCA
jgi:hypothetical protein